MKTKLSPKTKKLASALLTVMIMTGILSWAVMGYLSLIEQQNMLSNRSQTWNMAMGVVESGIEEGLEQLNCNITNLTGWTVDSTGYTYSRQNTLDDGTSYTVYLNLSNSLSPIVTAVAHVPMPVFASFFAAAGVNVGPNTVSRAVQVTCAKHNMFTAAIVAKHDINLNGNGVFIDSYDSSLPGVESTTSGQYLSTFYSGDHGDVETDGGIMSGAVGVQNGNIYGKVHTGPNCPVSVGPNGAVGTHAWQASNTGFEPGYVLQDANFTWPDTTAPSGTFFTPSSLTVTNAIVYSFTTNLITTNVCPSSMPASGVQTNGMLVTVSNLPNQLPSGTITTNSYVTNSTSLPSTLPANVLTNITTTPTTASAYPAPGTYIGGVSTNYDKHGRVTGYSFALITGVSYTWTVYAYTYAAFQYTYDLTQTNIVSMSTTYYPYALYAGHTNQIGSLGSGPIAVVGDPNNPWAPAVLILTGGLTGNEQFVFTQGASLIVYSGGTSVGIAGNTIVNPGGYAGNFVVLCGPTVTSFSVGGNGTFIGVVCAPSAQVALNGGGGNNNIDFCGSLMCDSITFNGHFSFHYDEALSKGPRNGRYLVNSWNEVNPNNY